MRVEQKYRVRGATHAVEKVPGCLSGVRPLRAEETDSLRPARRYRPPLLSLRLRESSLFLPSFLLSFLLPSFLPSFLPFFFSSSFASALLPREHVGGLVEDIVRRVSEHDDEMCEST